MCVARQCLVLVNSGAVGSVCACVHGSGCRNGLGAGAWMSHLHVCFDSCSHVMRVVCVHVVTSCVLSCHVCCHVMRVVMSCVLSHHVCCHVMCVVTSCVLSRHVCCHVMCVVTSCVLSRHACCVCYCADSSTLRGERPAPHAQESPAPRAFHRHST